MIAGLAVYFYEDKQDKIKLDLALTRAIEEQERSKAEKLAKEKAQLEKELAIKTALISKFKNEVKYVNAELANIISGIELLAGDTNTDINDNIFDKLDDEMYLTEYTKKHGISNYIMRYDWIKFPIRDPKDLSKPDPNTVITSEYDSRTIWLNRTDDINEFLTGLGMDTGSWKQVLNIPEWGRCYNVKVKENIIIFTQLHTGIDIVNKKNKAVYAPAIGYVISIYNNHKIFGNTVVIRCHRKNEVTGKMETFRINYCHLAEIKVPLKTMYNGKIGFTKVTYKTLIGLVGDTGKTLGTHLHWSIRKYDNPYFSINPFLNAIKRDSVSERRFRRGELY
jgi:hypothetical protein